MIGWIIFELMWLMKMSVDDIHFSQCILCKVQKGSSASETMRNIYYIIAYGNQARILPSNILPLSDNQLQLTINLSEL